VTTSVLHVIPALSRGGAGRALLTAARASSAVADVEHSVLSLRAADAWMESSARQWGLDVLNAPGLREATEAIRAADVVQLHFWNSPELYELLFADLPPMRLLVWSHVAGEHLPQVLIPELIEFADQTIASSPYTTELPGLEELDVIPAVAGWDRVEGVCRNEDSPFTVGFIGTLDFAKLHPSFVPMSARMNIPGGRFVVCGAGGALPALRRQASEHGNGARFDFRGYVEDIREALAMMDVFGYPLADGNSSTSELVLQEAMYAGVPPVVLGPGGARLAVVHNETGLVAEDEAEYQRAVEHLYAHPEERERLGAAAREHARRTWSAEKVAGRWVDTYHALVGRPKRTRRWTHVPETGAARFLQGLGRSAPQFAVSLGQDEGDVLAADRHIADSKAVLCTGAGGILAYRDHYPDDGWLRAWAGLVLHRQGRRALATGELAAAVRLGCDEARVRRYLARAALGARLRSQTCTIAYMGASVTLMKDGYRPRLHAMLQERLGREHVMVNAATGAIGAVGGLFLMEDLVLRHQPDLCFIEYASFDAGGATPPELLGPALLEIVLRLREASCEPCFLLLPREEPDAAVLDIYRRVAGHHGVPLIDVAAVLATEGRYADELLRDVVHPTPSGAQAIATAIADDLDEVLDPTAGPPAREGRLFETSFQGSRIVPATPEQLRDPSACVPGRFRFTYPYVEIGPGNTFDCSFDGELIGLVVLLGPESGVIRVNGRELLLFDRWCWYDRLGTVLLDGGFAPGSHVTVEMTDREVDRSVCERPLANPDGICKRLKVIGFMVRGC
jgi:glycosyltransferase involved in cell wall biosynthesis/lysophospholipase L1-like esterase